jgi:hypothetical protein
MESTRRASRVHPACLNTLQFFFTNNVITIISYVLGTTSEIHAFIHARQKPHKSGTQQINTDCVQLVINSQYLPSKTPTGRLLCSVACQRLRCSVSCPPPPPHSLISLHPASVRTVPAPVSFNHLFVHDVSTMLGQTSRATNVQKLSIFYFNRNIILNK